MDKKFYFIDKCPRCDKYTLWEVGFTKQRNKILKCGFCELIVLERDIGTTRKEINEDS